MLPWSIALALLVAPPARVPSVAPQELARIWDAEHVSPPLPPLLEHDEVERRMQTVSQGDPSRFIFERVGASLEGRSINMIQMQANIADLGDPSRPASRYVIQTILKY